MSSRYFALLAASFSTLLFGLNHLIAKDVVASKFPSHVLVFLRTSGSALLFWFSSLLIAKDKIKKEHLIRLVLCAMLGTSINMLSFFRGLSLSTPINSSLVVTIIPIAVAVLSVIFLKEKLYLLRAFGILLSMGGAISLIIFSEEKAVNAPNIPLGNFLFIINAVFFGSYLVIIKPLLSVYHPFNVMWRVFAIGAMINLPFAFYDYTITDWLNPENKFFSPDIILEIAYIVVFTTFVNQMSNMYALKRLNATTLSIFTYLQPAVVIIISVFLGIDHMNLLRYVACGLIFTGVYIVSKKQNKN